MFFPPSDFRHTLQVHWYAGLFGVVPGVCIGVILRPEAGWTVFWVLLPPLIILSLAAAWLSVFGRRHAVFSASLIWFVLLLPAALLCAILTMPKGREHIDFGVLGLVTGIQAFVLVLACVWHARKAPIPTGSEEKIEWPGTRVNLVRRRISPSDAPSGPGMSVIGIGLLGVPLYHALKPWLQTGKGMLFFAVLMNAGIGVMSVTIVARAIAQGIRLAAIERRIGPVACDRLEEIEKVRQKYRIGRFLRSRFPLPASLDGSLVNGRNRGMREGRR